MRILFLLLISISILSCKGKSNNIKAQSVGPKTTTHNNKLSTKEIDLEEINTKDINEQLLGIYERETLLSGCSGYDRLELNKDNMRILSYDKCGTGKMHLSTVLYSKWKINGNRIDNSMDSVYDYYPHNKLARIIRKARSSSNYKFEYIGNNAGKHWGYYVSYDRTLCLLRDTSQSIIIIEKNAPDCNWSKYHKIE